MPSNVVVADTNLPRRLAHRAVFVDRFVDDNPAVDPAFVASDNQNAKSDANENGGAGDGRPHRGEHCMTRFARTAVISTSVGVTTDLRRRYSRSAPTGLCDRARAPGDRRPLTSPSFSPQFATQALRAVEMIVEDPPCHIQQVSDKRIAECVSYRESFFLRRDDALIPQHCQLLRYDRLVEHQFALQLLHSTSASHQYLQHPDPGGVGQ